MASMQPCNLLREILPGAVRLVVRFLFDQLRYLYVNKCSMKCIAKWKHIAICCDIANHFWGYGNLYRTTATNICTQFSNVKYDLMIRSAQY